MTTSTISDVITVLTAEQLFCVIKRFPRVWFSLISTNPFMYAMRFLYHRRRFLLTMTMAGQRFVPGRI